MHTDRLPDPIPSDRSPSEIADDWRERNPGEPPPTRVRKQIEIAELQRLLDRAERRSESARDPLSQRRAANRVTELQRAIAERWPDAYPVVAGDGPPAGPDDATCRCGVQISRRQRFDSGYCGRCIAAFRGQATTNERTT